MTVPFLFGIPGLDDLVAAEPSAADAASFGRPWTAALVGPDGCGKSILSLLLASHYWSLHCSTSNSRSRVLYVSTDLSHQQAKTQWINFGCDFPQARERAIAAAYKLSRPAYVTFNPAAAKGTDCELEPLLPSDDSAIQDFLAGLNRGVFFLDLHSETTGDDWGYINRLLGLMNRDVPPEHRHLLLLDAVEGLEALVGDLDAFGQNRSRRSRVAQLIRNAKAANSHVLLVVEEAKRNVRLPEQFVTDMVIRLRARRQRGYSQRTVEVEKCRALAHARGEHELGIRKGNGTSTGKSHHLDEPQVPWRIAEDEHGQKKQIDLAHIHVVKSLHLWNREVREEIASLPELVGAPQFLGLPELNAMLQRFGRTPAPATPPRCQGSFSFVLGDAGTHKTVLASHFLAGAFVSDDGSPRFDNGVALLITTGLTDPDMLTRRLAACLALYCPQLKNRTASEIEEQIRPHVLCRRMGVRHTGSSDFQLIIERYVREAQRLLEIDVNSTIEVRRTTSNRIHFVLDDWNQLLSTHPNFSDDPLLVQSILSILKREALSSLIVSTQPGQPTLPETALAEHDLRKLDENQILTWSVPFFGERRVAVTAFPALAAKIRPVVYELAVGASNAATAAGSADFEGARINRHFALYSDVDRGLPQRVPLLVRLYEGNHPSQNTENKPAYAQMLRDTLTQVFPNAPSGAGVVSFEPYNNYDSMFLFADSLDDSQLDHSLAFQIDEFWTIGKNSIADHTSYWKSPVATWDEKAQRFQPSVDEDVYRMHQPHSHDVRARRPEADDLTPRVTSRHPNRPLEYTRADMFVSDEDGGPVTISGGRVDRIPYHWDFGLLLTHRDPWYRYRSETIPVGRYGSQGSWKIEDIWNALCLPDAGLQDKSTFKYVPWDCFLAACRYIAERENCEPFAFDRSTPETLHCLLLELWSSLEWEMVEANNASASQSALQQLSDRRRDREHSLRWFLENNPLSLFLAFQWLVEHCPDLRQQQISGASPASRRPVLASREWYHTASAIMKRAEAEHDLEVLALPGHYSTRGDWSLAIARGSRSLLLAERAADLLSSRRMNMLRLQDGIGLPVRDVVPDSAIGSLSTALTSRQNSNEWRREHVSYRDLCSLGSLDLAATKPFEFHWLWRSQIRDYDRSVFYWRQWIVEILRSQHEWVVRDTSLPQLTEEAAQFFGQVRFGTATWTKIAEVWKVGAKKIPLFDRFLRKIETLCATLRN